MDKETFELSRRKALLGLGTIGVASTGAALGTSAYFSDQEEFTDNTIQAGEFSLTVEQYISHLDQDGIGPDETGLDGDSPWAANPIEIEDAKPGDEYEFCWEITVHDNPGYVVVIGPSEESVGDLDELPWDIEDEDDLETLGENADATLTTTVDGEDYELEYGNLAELLENLADGIIVSMGEGDPIQFEPGETVTVCLEIVIPEDVGNEIQGASTSVDMTFYAEQARHNDAESVLESAQDEFGDD